MGVALTYVSKEVKADPEIQPDYLVHLEINILGHLKINLQAQENIEY